MGQVIIAPMNRIEGHHDIDAHTDANGIVTTCDAKVVMFRGIENILIGRDPRDAPIISQRSCGVCPITHGAASSKAVGEAFGFKVDASHAYGGAYPGFCSDGITEDVPDNGRILRNIAMAANYLQSHILHFYHLVALDYVDVNATGLIPKGFTCPTYDNNYYARAIDPVLQTNGLGAPAYSVNAYDYGSASWKNTGGANAMTGAGTLDWNPSLGLAPALGDLTAYFAGQYVRALKMRRISHALGAIFTGKMPHASVYTPGCMSCKAYDPNPGGPDTAVVQKVHELLYGGPGFYRNNPSLIPKDGGPGLRIHPHNGQPVSINNPHPESLLGFIGKPSDFWNWAAGVYPASELPLWAAPGVPGAGTNWKPYTGTFCFDTVAAAHVFPEYFWYGSGWSRYLSWGIFEGANPPLANTPDNRLLTRGRVHTPFNPNGSGTPYGYAQHAADHMKAAEFTSNSLYYDPAGANNGRHMWDGKTTAVPMGHPWLATAQGGAKANAYSYAKSPRYQNNESGGGWEASNHPNGSYLAYEVGPLARLVSNAVMLATPGGPANTAEVVAVDNGNFCCYYPGILRDVDVVLGSALGIPGGSIGVMPGWAGNASASGNPNLANHLTWAVGAGVFYLPPNAIAGATLSNLFHSDYAGSATLDRIAARTIETYYVCKQMLSWFNQIDPPAAGTGAKKPTDVDYNPAYPYDSRWPNYTRKFHDGTKPAPYKAQGAGLTEAPRGALGHWIRVYQGKVYNYQEITPTAWNVCPKDAVNPPTTLGQEGPAEKTVIGTPLVSDSEPIEIIRVLHSFDFCCACTVHVMDAKKRKVAEVTVEPSA